MSKYQVALDNVKIAPSFMGGNDEYRRHLNSSVPFLKDIAILQELVDKETPMKAIVYNINQFKCPRCKKQIKGRLMLYNMETRKRDIKCKTKVEKIYCPYCSQKLDWGDECE